MRALIKRDPYCQYYIGKAIAYRIAASLYPADKAYYGLFRSLMRDNAKFAIKWVRISKGAV